MALDDCISFPPTDEQIKDSSLLYHGGEIAQLGRRFYQQYPPHFDRAYEIYRWVTNTIEYDEALANAIDRGQAKGMRGARETLRDRKGVCIEMAALYVSLAQCANLDAGLVLVHKTADKKKDHACGYVMLREMMYYVDPAYKEFGVLHRRVEPISDLQAEEYYHAINGLEMPQHLRSNRSPKVCYPESRFTRFKRRATYAIVTTGLVFSVGFQSGRLIERTKDICDVPEFTEREIYQKEMKQYVKCLVKHW